MGRATGQRQFVRIGSFGGFSPSDGISDTFEPASRDTDTNLVLGETSIGSKGGRKAATSVEDAQKLLENARDINELGMALEATRSSPQVLKAASDSKEKLRKEREATVKALETEVSKLDRSWQGTGVHAGEAGSV
ncbi:MAG: hypothetical protein ABSG17_00685 [Spirochaetia bacterium]|jgi:hypothetical protein